VHKRPGAVPARVLPPCSFAGAPAVQAPHVIGRPTRLCRGRPRAPARGDAGHERRGAPIRGAAVAPDRRVTRRRARGRRSCRRRCRRLCGLMAHPVRRAAGVGARACLPCARAAPRRARLAAARQPARHVDAAVRADDQHGRPAVPAGGRPGAAAGAAAAPARAAPRRCCVLGDRLREDGGCGGLRVRTRLQQLLRARRGGSRRAVRVGFPACPTPYHARQAEKRSARWSSAPRRRLPRRAPGHPRST